MNRYYLSYTITLLEPMILGNGSQIGNVLMTHTFIPGSALLGLCASLYIREGKAVADANGIYSEEFRALFLSYNTLFSNAYPLAERVYPCMPMPMSVMGCKHYGTSRPGGPDPDQHGFLSYLYTSLPANGRCGMPGCGALLEHKRDYCFWDSAHNKYCDHGVATRILSHNQVAEKAKDKAMFSFESIMEGQVFEGEISCAEEAHRDILWDLLSVHPEVKMGKARQRGYGGVEIAVAYAEKSQRAQFGPQYNGKIFSITLFSDAIVPDQNLNYSQTPTEEILLQGMGLPDSEGANLEVFLDPRKRHKSFFKSIPVRGFNQTRRMPLPVEWAVERGSVFTLNYSGGQDISDNLKQLQQDGIGIRRNEGFGQVIVNAKIHGTP